MCIYVGMQWRSEGSLQGSVFSCLGSGDLTELIRLGASTFAVWFE